MGLTVEEQIKRKILQSFKSLRAFTNEIGLPYSTVDTMLKKGIRFSTLETVLRVCRGLQLDIRALEQERAVNLPSADSLLISEEERNHIRQYRALDFYGKKAVDGLLTLEYERVQEQEAYHEKLTVAARSNQKSVKSLTIRRDFQKEEIEGEESEF